MSEADDIGPGEDGLGGDDLFAAEYVLGTLAHAHRLAAATRIAADPAFAALVSAWEARLDPLNADYAEVPPPDLMPRIEARLFGEPAAGPRRGLAALLARLTLPAYAGLAVAVFALAAFLWSLFPAPAPLVATLQAEGQPVTFAAAYRPASGQLTLTRTGGPAPAAGKDYELWSVGASGTPAPLGLVSAPEVSHRVPGLAAGIVLAVSLEPAGGSPNGKPTLVLVSGKLARP